MTKQERENWHKEMFTLIEQWEISGISHKSFCDQHDLRSHVFYYWLNKYKRTRSTSGSSFVPVEISPGEPKSKEQGEIHIQYPNGVMVILNESVNISRLRALIKAV
jgi:transposase-like protein